MTTERETRVKVYDPDGVEHLVLPVDAKEYVASGHYTREPKKAEPPARVDPPKIQVVTPTK